MSTLHRLCFAAFFAIAGAFSPSQDPAELRARGETLAAEGSFELARREFEAALAAAQDPAQRRELEFRAADAAWRALAATAQGDPSGLDAARKRLEALVRDVERADQRDELFARVHESLGDFHWTRRDSQDWHGGWQHYQQALAVWAASTDLELARERYLAIVWKASSPQGARFDHYNWIQTPDDVLDNAIAIAEGRDDKARAHVLRAMALSQRGGDWASMRRAPREFEAALEGGRAQEWYDDALFAYAQWLEQRGRVVRGANGAWTTRPDYVKALELYRRLAEEFGAGESRWLDDARARAKEIVAPSLALSVGSTFLPGSEVFVNASWRNVERIDFALYAVDLAEDVDFQSGARLIDVESGIDESRGKLHARWTRATEGASSHAPADMVVGVEGTLPEGAYLLEATAQGLRDVEVVLVSRTNALLVSSPSKVLVWATDAVTSVPLAEARIVFFECAEQSSGWLVKKHESVTRADGTAEFARSADARANLVVCVQRGASQAFATSHHYHHRERGAAWRVQAITDRPAYRPDETIHWKFVARRFDGERYSTPAGDTLAYTLRDARGEELAKGLALLDEFGSAWGELATTAKMALGELQLELRHARHDGDWIAGAVLARLEEYKLPEFEVRVATPRDGERVRTFRSGDEVEAEVRASYYSGGPVANARVELVVRQSPLWRLWRRPREFAWLDAEPEQRWRGDGGTVVLQQTITTDAAGVARVRFPTPLDANQDFEYTLEARVTDASRREVVGQGAVRVARQSYTVHPSARHNLHHVGEPIEIDFKLVDANEQPVAASGEARVHREWWFERWRAGDGRELDLAEYERLSAAERLRATSLGRGYRRELVSTHALTANAAGEAFLSFQVQREGAYSVEWSSSDVDGGPITAATTVWVASDVTSDVGWRRGGLELVLDREQARAGEKLDVLITSSRGAGWVLLCVESEELHEWRVVEMQGPVKLTRIALDERHVPNVFLSAYTSIDGLLWRDAEQLDVPPVEQFLTVDVSTEALLARPGAEAEWRLRVRDAAGKPVRAQLSFALIDEAVLAIQRDYAVDPREFFYGDRRASHVQYGSTVQWRRFVEFVKREDGTYGERRFARADGESGKQFDGSAVRDQLAQLGYAQGADDMVTELSARVAAKGVRGDANIALEFRGLGAPPAAEAAPGGESQIVVRSDFRATAHWLPDVVTGEDGTAVVEVRYPQSLSRWKATARAATAQSKFGIASASAQTDLPLTVRLQAPRFFVVGDECAVSALIDNHTAAELTVEVALAADGLDVVHGPREPLRVPANAQVRAEWHVSARAHGVAKLRVTARGRGGDELVADAMERTYEVHEHGIEQLIAKSGALANGAGVVSIELPAARRPGSTRFVVRASPSTAATMLDALPYLVDYPYGCVEQTMSRFLPAAITARTLRELGVDPELAMARVFGGVEGEFAAKTHPKGAKSLALLDEVSAQSLARLYDMQQANGGWGWWKTGECDHFMSAYVVWGLALAREAGVDVRADVLERGAQHLVEELVEAEEQPDLQAWVLHALAVHFDALDRKSDDKRVLAAADNLWAKRDSLNAHTRALFALAAKHMSQDERASALARALTSGAIVDRSPDVSVVSTGAQVPGAHAQATAHWGEGGIARRWSDAPVETTAAVLRALLAIDPKNELVDMSANWLVRNRRGAQWSSTRDTALAVLSLCGYLKSSGELEADFDCAVVVNGTRVGERRFEPRSALGAPFAIELDPALLASGANRVEFVRTRGAGRLYFAIEARWFNQEEPVREAGNEVFVRREYFVLEPVRTLLNGVVIQKHALQGGEALASGARVECVITLEAKNDLEYLMVEDLKPAGLEAVDLTSGGGVEARELRADAFDRRLAHGTTPGAEGDGTGRARAAHRELRDRKVALFLDRLPQGVWELRHELRAETPGTFHALPAIAQAMYVPEIRGNSVERSLRVE